MPINAAHADAPIPPRLPVQDIADQQQRPAPAPQASGDGKQSAPCRD